MKIVIAISFFFASVNLSIGQTTFEEEYAKDYTQALQKVESFMPILDSITKTLKVPKKEIISIVFPEMVRYSIYSDAAQLAMLELFYVEKGANYANFSVGAFQIKPSFVEQLEQEVLKNKKMKKKYSFILFNNDSLPEKTVRIIRINRLKNIHYQIAYVCCFYEIMDLKYKKQNFDTVDEKLRLFATSYNSGMYLSYEALIKMQKVKLFPEGKICFKCINYNYSDVVIEFYKKLK